MSAPAELPPDVEALVLAILGKRVKERTDLVKALIGGRYEEGHKETFRSPLDQAKLGQIWRSDPDPKWIVTDRDALHSHLRTFPGVVETVWEIVDERAAVEVLKVHAPELLVEITRVRADVVEAALAESRETGKATAPGIALVKPGGTLTVKPDAAGAASVERLVQAGLITWDGRPVLDAGEQAAS